MLAETSNTQWTIIAVICVRRVRCRPSSLTCDRSWSVGRCRSHVSTISLCLKRPLGSPVPVPGCSELPLCRPRARVPISSASYTRVWRLEGSGTALFEPPSLKPSLTTFQLSVWLWGWLECPHFWMFSRTETGERLHGGQQNSMPVLWQRRIPVHLQQREILSRAQILQPQYAGKGQGALGSQADIPAHFWQYSHPCFFFF